MDSNIQQCYQTAQNKVESSADRGQKHEPVAEVQLNGHGTTAVNQSQTLPSSSLSTAQSTTECTEVTDILARIKSGQLLMVNSRRRNGLILRKQYHAEFAGPGAAVGGFFDEDCQQVIPVGDLSLVHADSHEERQKAYLIRRQWIRLTQQFTDKSVPIQRAQMILNQFENYFDQDTIARIPDDAFALLVGVLPYTIRMARRPPSGGQLKVKVKA